MRRTLYGSPIRRTGQSDTTTLIVEPSAGFNSSQPMSDLQPGQTPYSRNALFREGGMELRPTLSIYTANENPVGYVTGGYPVISSLGTHYPLISGTTQFAYYSAGSWSALSYVSAGGNSAPPSAGTNSYYDITQTYEATVDEMIAIAACESYQTLFSWVAGSGVLSSITSAPRANCVAVLDNFVVAANIRDVGSGQSKYIQRVQWSDRGAPLVWTPASSNLAGFEDLLSAKGEIRRVMTQDERLIIFFDDEIWQGNRTTGAASFGFAPFDKTVGCPYRWTICQTPLGLMFLGRDLMVYLLPKGGGTATPVGYPVRRHLQNRISNPAKAWSTYDQATNTFRLYYPIISGSGLPTEAVWLNLGENAWAPQSFGMNLTRGFASQDENISSGISWTGMTGTWSSQISSWDQLAAGSIGGRTVAAVGTSDGTMYYDSVGTMDDMLPVTAQWRSQGLGADTPGRVKVMRGVRIDYQSPAVSHLTFRASRDQGANFDAAQGVDLPIIATEGGVDAWPYTVALYPSFEVQWSDPAMRIFRFWIETRQGGRPT